MSLSALARMSAGSASHAARQPPHSTMHVGRTLPGTSVSAATTPPGQRPDGFDNLVKYIPTETVTIFLAICSARATVETIWGSFPYGIVYAACAALTPLLLWLIAAGRHRTAGGSGPVPLHWWPPTAATIAFLFWAMSVPGVTGMFAAQEQQQAAWGVLAGIAALLVSLLLSLLEPLFASRSNVPPTHT